MGYGHGAVFQFAKYREVGMEPYARVGVFSLLLGLMDVVTLRLTPAMMRQMPIERAQNASTKKVRNVHRPFEFACIVETRQDLVLLPLVARILNSLTIVEAHNLNRTVGV